MITCPRCAHHFHPGHQGLTPRQLEVFVYIERYVLRRRCAPSYEEIRDAMELRSLASVAEYLDLLERKGVLSRDRRSPRSITLLVRSDEIA